MMILGWSLFGFAATLFLVACWDGKRWYRLAMEYRAQRDVLAGELAMWKSKRGQS